MSTKALEVERALRNLVKPGKREVLMRFFKTGPGQYGEGDEFLGVMVPQQRDAARLYQNLARSEIKALLASPIHECRLTALLILVLQYHQADAKERARLHQFYLNNFRAVNNWDLVDLTAPTLIGDYLLDKPKGLLDKMSQSDNLWLRRASIVASYAFIRQGDNEWTYRLAKKFLTDKHDLMHKATGWMLREAGKRNEGSLIKFLEHNYQQIPRTMLRYAIERLDAKKRQYFLKLN